MFVVVVSSETRSYLVGVLEAEADAVRCREQASQSRALRGDQENNWDQEDYQVTLLELKADDSGISMKYPLFVLESWKEGVNHFEYFVTESKLLEATQRIRRAWGDAIIYIIESDWESTIPARNEMHSLSLQHIQPDLCDPFSDNAAFHTYLRCRPLLTCNIPLQEGMEVFTTQTGSDPLCRPRRVLFEGTGVRIDCDPDSFEMDYRSEGRCGSEGLVPNLSDRATYLMCVDELERRIGLSFSKREDLADLRSAVSWDQEDVRDRFVLKVLEQFCSEATRGDK